MENKSFLLYGNYINQIALLSDEEAGLIFKAILRYVEYDEDLQTDDRMLYMTFSFFKTQIEREKEKYSEICQKRTEAIKKRWQKQKNTKEYNCIQTIQKNTNDTKEYKRYKSLHIDSDIDIDSDIGSNTIDSITHDIKDINNNLKETYNINIIDKEKSATNVALNLKKRKDKFVETLDPYVSIYGEELIEDFIGYWTEPNKSLTKMRFELERTWDVKRRLLTWATRASQYKKSYATRQSVQKRTDGAAAIIAQLAAEDDAKRQVR